MQNERQGSPGTPRQPYEIEIRGEIDIDSLSRLSANIARDRQQPVFTILDEIVVVAQPEDSPATIAERWVIENDLRA
jgi:hypothetical protein